jgi:cytidylate kinase
LKKKILKQVQDDNLGAGVMMTSMMIAIDGPAGAGKGTLARHLAHIYHLAHLDTGLLYRAVAHKVIEASLSPKDEAAAIQMASSLKAEDLKNPALRKEHIGNVASQISVIPDVRRALLKFQRDFAQTIYPGKQGVVLDGRDIGLVILPEAPCKIFVTASPEVRAKRRLKELHQNGNASIYDSVLEDIKARDSRDEQRKVSPLRPAEDAYILDTSELTVDEVVEKACLFVDSKYPHMQKITASLKE